MKKHVLQLLMAIGLIVPTALRAQRTFSDARINYRIDLPPEQLQMDALLANSTLTQYIRGESSRIDMNLNIVNYTYLLDSKKRTMITLVDRHGDKYKIVGDKTAYEKETRHYESIKFTDQQEVKEILGYKCRRSIGKMEDGTTFEVYYSPDLLPENRLYNRRFMNLQGIPLEFEIISGPSTRMKVIATKIDLSPVPASVFDVPAGYKEISPDELKKLRE
ncbi:DUF4412 domain-containing protein [Chitinophaga sedimenti]|uniref:DUF4412 domain-containing protein n=1 Tax=Chitinophaga sedimenti TaxID=2033606 RepID=UPI0020049DF3|nr:DUF4412 domain-containing protein [Chitinophaga sedimenti]MCK7559943.1 DUF4412 domain-containing protein [Chitinophaga sedimenti]